jgi:hypothetical protein
VEKLEFVEDVEIYEIVNVYARVADVSENTTGWQTQLGEYPPKPPQKHSASSAYDGTP